MKLMKKRFLIGLGMALLIFSSHGLLLDVLVAKELPSNKVAAGRISNSKAEALIEAWFLNEDKDDHLIDKGQKFPVKEVTPKEVWGGLKSQVFVVVEKKNMQLNAGEAFLIKDMMVYPLGFNVTEYCLADLNNDGIKELIFVQRSPSDLAPDAVLGVFSEGFTGPKVLINKPYYSGGDYHLKKINNQSVEVEVDNYAFFTFVKESTFALGRVGLLNRNGRTECTINFYPHLPKVANERIKITD